MRGVSRRLLRDEVTVETRTGEGAYGPVRADGIAVACKVSWTRRLVRDASGAEVVSELTLHVHPDDESLFAADSLVTIGDYHSRVISVEPSGRPGETVVVEVVCA